MLTGLTLTEARAGLAARSFSARELAKAHLDAIARLNPALNAYITVLPEETVLAQADAADARYAAGTAGLMDGLPIGIKDLFCTKDIRTTAASPILADFVPPYESTVTARLLKEGAVFLGKTNLDEFAMGSANTSSAFGATTSPWRRTDAPDVALVPGGSSGGSSAAVAAGLALAATGTDTGGSIRQPAAYCGIVGLKPTYGRCSRWGVIAYASSLDQAGPMTRSVTDAGLMLEAMAGFDERDSTSASRPVPAFHKAVGKSVKGLRVGIPTEYRAPGLPEDVLAMWEQGIAWLREAGCEVVDVSLPHTRYGLTSYYIIAPAECSSNLARYDGIRFGKRVDAPSLDAVYEASRAAGFGPEVRSRILMGTYVLSAGYYDAYYLKAQKVRTLIRRDFEQAFETVDVLLTPTAPSAAFAQGENQNDPVQMYLNDIFTVPASLAGIPGLSVPVGLNGAGLPLGLQVLGRHFDEETVLSVGGALEAAAGFAHRPTLHAGAGA
ncbi:Asp-tRNA(Asn)/Glu-tRNA(Gln) amidotransferase subunit GatA [Acetobacter peroxydans]|jgi:aspartyl-tRNA(Asn)/glutamyl-tRNA(Gln) amidotransferase subunit A|uniref:Glutamyl-tRNA(Gln) amidotransferase subunit A n=1 Tax=Acetobacter peroxydans TaxID=104098 RepID=A0A4Y3TXW9_9PROT|nr:Asp-tRNA(Asn)/Glu-tRNA(Gln) amidotransferase subunit GatA [Acetobacter peroxydans]MCH4144286.1 Asp-tRNA(Asn)/Glu-tRNA(Gln) amidotransferase subunit GatA [Acetobacter peroxydans]MCI1395717.1 Asp-tRNA(Asn)/Glu-tRNA(Gln) amidotransferase subunit GatA [Acetobacter peroxydans]MCI1412332.1 Asp-tRNA(Asn)/Glu-tRNA(Gln) amidotransferase subunit GatA [Acetobacter peroxydans]MCI1440422.1 Asp-tRNA(Asn)/Glu-tRNA(Gln) amidotransferase subunit GatA [Acetobacter peroxydans]MCI1567695.1 Asp-tRNA(Asn)/Glu-tR